MTTMDLSPPQIRKKKNKQHKQRQSRKGLIGSKAIQKFRDPSSVNVSFFALGIFLFAIFGGSKPYQAA
ncbi:hypothetical protein MAM1_0231d08432 [Mucor ambiguus]|uniref:Stress-associated endoplasmic reticulum protein n=1 Tax=Mucor ambiguus TaxID=91626 RepID=A0A0C9MZ84_9FUNG|nr:hypothetical protein MAM1_0231d08432 [Mucor ambiguus]